MNSGKVTAELKQKTLKAAKKAYFTRKVLQTGSAALAGAAVIAAAVLFFPKSTPSPDITTEITAAAKEVYVDEDVPANEFLTIYGAEMIGWDLVTQYNQIKGTRKLANPYSLDALGTNSVNDLEEALIKDLVSGAGPDIIFFTELSRSTKSLAQAGYLADMDKIINSHPDFNINDYSTDVLDSVLTDGKRYYIPTHYNMRYHISTLERFTKYGLEIPDELDLDAYFSLAESYFSKAENDLPLSYSYTMNQIAYEFANENYISKDAKTEKYFELIKEELKRTEAISSWDMELVYYENYFSDKIDKYLKNDFLFFSRSYLSNPKTLYDFLISFENKIIEENASDSLLIYPDRLNPEGIVKGYTSGNIAINANSPLKNEAFDFVKFILSEQIQSSEYFLSGEAPVNRKSFDAMKQDMLETAAADGKTELAEKIIGIIESAGEFSDVRNPAYNIFDNGDFEKYLDGEISFGEMSDSVNEEIRQWNANNR